MNDADVFNTMLNAMGLTTAAQRQVITNQQVTNLTAFSRFTEEELKLTFEENNNANRRRAINNQVVIPVQSRTLLEGLRYNMELRALCQAEMTDAFV